MIDWKAHPTISFAQEELRRYCLQMDPASQVDIAILPMPKTMRDKLLEGKNEAQCDAFAADIVKGKGTLYAISPRSALLGVYQLLRHAGCRFVRPGKDGEYIPSRSLADLEYRRQLCSRYFHRGITIEGAVSVQNVLDIVDWAPKVGYNSYFIQFRDGFQFFDRWYSHEGNPLLGAEGYTREECKKDQQQIVQQIKKRSMMLHGVGHGWTSAAVGIDAGGWYEVGDDSISNEQRAMLAELDGERKFYTGKPLNTQLCYSNINATDGMIREIVAYAQDNPQVDYLHIWLADDFNNFCECRTCKKNMPADLYVRMLNSLDEELSKRNLNTKIVFIAYYELLWAPVKEKIHNESRFTLMFAPMFRSYTESYKGSELPESLPEYNRNHVTYPRDNGLHLRFLQEWKKVFSGDCFSFEYHLMWDQYRNVGQYELARILFDDISVLNQHGLNGIMSCQLNRCAFPTAFPNYMMGHALLDESVTFDQLENEYLGGAFGEFAKAAGDYLREIGTCFSFRYHADQIALSNDIISGLKKVPYCTKQLTENLTEANANTCVNGSIRILRNYALIYERVADMLVWKLEQETVDFNSLYQMWREFITSVWEKEPELQHAVDTFYFDFITKEYLFRGYHDQLEKLETLGKRN